MSLVCLCIFSLTRKMKCIWFCIFLRALFVFVCLSNSRRRHSGGFAEPGGAPPPPPPRAAWSMHAAGVAVVVCYCA